MKKSYRKLSLVLALIWGGVSFAQNPGELNTNFGSNGYQWYDQGSNDQEALAICTQADGKILVGGMNEHTPNKTDWTGKQCYKFHLQQSQLPQINRSIFTFDSCMSV